jgi:hypothetical protein
MIMTDADYFKEFHWIVTVGVGCGLEHPLEWAVQALRTPGGTLSPEYYATMEAVMPRFLVEMYEATYNEPPLLADDVLAWSDEHFKENDMMRGFFKYLRDDIAAFIEAR